MPGRHEARPSTWHIPLEQLLVKQPVSAGMNLEVVSSLVPLYRGTTEDTTPIVVRREAAGWRVMDGRHRFIASLIAGRASVLASEEGVP